MDTLDKYNNIWILRKVANYKFTFSDVAPKRFPQLVPDLPLYCDFHENSHRGKHNARLTYNEETNKWCIYCFTEHKNFYVSDYIERILIKEKEVCKTLKEYITNRMSNEEFISLYNMFKKQDLGNVITTRQKRIEHINNTFYDNPNAMDFIENLYMT